MYVSLKLFLSLHECGLLITWYKEECCNLNNLYVLQFAYITATYNTVHFFFM